MSLIKYLLNFFKNKQFGVTIPLGTFSKKVNKDNSSTEKQVSNTINNNSNVDKSASGNLSNQPDLALTKEKIGEVNETDTPVKSSDNRETFIRKMWPIAETIHETFGIHPFITITQSAHESGWGVSKLTLVANNLYGKKGGSWVNQRRPVVWMETWEESNFPSDKIKYFEFPDDVIDKKPNGKGGTILRIKAPFRKYESWLLSIQDWATSISQRSQYQLAYEHAKKGDGIRFAHEIQAAGYATDSNYALKLIDVHKAVEVLTKKIANV